MVLGLTLTAQAQNKQQFAGYLFAYFEGGGDTKLMEQLRFAVSEDAQNWYALNGNRPIIGSDSINSAEDLYAEELRTLATPLNRRNKRLLDVATALVLIVLWPVLVWLQRPRGQYLPHCWQVLIGKKTWVGTDGGATREGVFGPEDGLPRRAKSISPALKERLHLRYLRNYKLTTDLQILLKNLCNL